MLSAHNSTDSLAISLLYAWRCGVMPHHHYHEIKVKLLCAAEISFMYIIK